LIIVPLIAAITGGDPPSRVEPAPGRVRVLPLTAPRFTASGLAGGLVFAVGSSR